MESDLSKIKNALEIASEFCGKHTADDCPDSVAIPINDALKIVNEYIKIVDENSKWYE